MAKFSWDASALVREIVTISIEGEELIFTEFSKSNCDRFLSECVETKVTEEVPDPDNAGKTLFKRRPVSEVTKQQSALVNKWLAVASGKDIKFFTRLEETISSWAYGHLVEMLFSINHVNDILAIGGNYLLLPTALEVARQEGLAEATTN
jgi:hypothetical protein